MTKEEAIEWLKSLNYCDGEETQEVAQAIEMAIKALEQQSSDDCVSRQAVLKLLESYVDEESLNDGLNNICYEFVSEKIKKLPPITPTLPEGATNGDMIKVMLPNLKVEDNGGSIYLHYPNGGWIVIDKDWWNAPYKG